MKYLLDTCIISALTKKSSDSAAINWIDEQDENSLFLSALTLGEIQKGISRLGESAKKNRLQSWLEQDLVGRLWGVSWTLTGR